MLSVTKRMFLFCCLAIVLVGCAEGGGNAQFPVTSPIVPTTNPIAVSSATPTATALSVEQMEIESKWENGPHAHAAEAVGCRSCHRLQDGALMTGIAWWDADAGRYVPVDDGNDLCLKCHNGYDTAQMAHADMACLDCHDQHSARASCFTCHEQVKQEALTVPPTPVDGHPNGGQMAYCESAGCHSVATQVAQMPFSVHGGIHAAVTCAACHEADGYEVGPVQDGNEWVVWLPTALNGETVSMPYQSHNLQYTVDCTRCHYEANPWGLPLMDGSKNGG